MTIRETSSADLSTPSIVHVSQTTITGVSRCVADLVRWQVEQGWRVAVACPPEEPLWGEVGRAGATPLSWEAARGPSLATATEVVRLTRLVGSWDPAVIHLHSSKAGLAGRLSIRGRRPTIFQPHGWSFAAVSGAARAAAVRWERRAAPWAEVLLCVSDDERRHGEAAGIAGRWRVIENAVDLDRFSPADATARRDSRRRLEVGDGPLVVCIGRLCPQKGQDLLVDAWPAVRHRLADARLVLVGDGPTRSALHARAGSGVALVGERHDVADWLHAADVVAVPSRWEGMSLIALEAMASARSVVACDVEGMAALLDPSGEPAGGIVPCEDPRALAVAITRRLLDAAVGDREGLNGRRRAERHHGLGPWLDAMGQLTRDVAASSSTVEQRRGHGPPVTRARGGAPPWAPGERDREHAAAGSRP